MKIEIHNTTYVFLLISFLAGYFEFVYLLLIIIFIHETGHYALAKINNLEIKKIVIYPFGGITILDCDLNTKINKELLTLLGGIVFQIIFFILITKIYQNNLITSHVYNLIKRINILLIEFNFLPVLPLDGGKLMNILLDKIFPYKLSHKISIVISIIFIIYFPLKNKTLISFLLSIFLIKNLIEEIRQHNIKYNKFLLERYLNKYKFNKTKIIKNKYYLKRDFYHIIDNTFEEKYLSKMFDRNI